MKNNRKTVHFQRLRNGIFIRCRNPECPLGQTGTEDGPVCEHRLSWYVLFFFFRLPMTPPVSVRVRLCRILSCFHHMLWRKDMQQIVQEVFPGLGGVFFQKFCHWFRKCADRKTGRQQELSPGKSGESEEISRGDE